MKLNRLLPLLGGFIMAMTLCSCGQKDLAINDFKIKEFGENIYFITEKDSPQKVNSMLKKLWAKQETNQFGDERYAVYFMPGDYPNVEVNVGFYTQVAGLGKTPSEVKLNSLNTNARWLGDDSNHMALCNFWRGIENLEVSENTEFAVSQATFIRRMKFDKSLILHDNYGWASGGFLADSVIEKIVDSGSQQQWLSRNNQYMGWSGENWNIVFLGDDPAGIPDGTWPQHSYTTYSKTPIIQEKPFLTYDDKEGFGVFVPNIRSEAQGVSWADSEAPDTLGRFIPISEFYLAKPESDNADSINRALAEGKNILLTPGIFNIDTPIKVEKGGTIVLGTGLATLRSVNGSVCMETSDKEGIIIAGILFDAGMAESPNLLVVGAETPGNKEEHSGQSPISLSDLFFRIGGAKTESPCKTDVALTINASNVVGDNFWIWRADHTDMVGWDLNTANTGIVINGNDVTCYALMVEHFQKYQTIVNGERNEIIMYQSETPYDAPSALDWKCSEDKLGYSSIYVGDSVKEFKGTAIGIYLYNRDAITPLISAVTVPDTEGVSLRNVITVLLNGYPGIRYPVNEAGNSVMRAGDTAKVLYYCNGDWK